jgi:very-short-patch-repair endonuclease
MHVLLMSFAPIELRGGPFTVARARDVGLKWDSLQTRQWRRMARGQYAWTGLPDEIELKLRAAEQRLPPEHAFSGRTAAWILGLDMAPCEPIEATIARDANARARVGVKLRRAALPEEDVAITGGFRVTNGLRTARDLGSRADLFESVVAIDMAVHAGLVDLATLSSWVSCNTGAKGVKRLRRVLALANPLAESPMETRLRLELVTARLPNPCVQVDLHDAHGDFLGRVDMYYPDARLVIEYDGKDHKDRLVEDLRRQNALINAGYHVLRFTAPDLRFRGAAASQVRRARRLLLSTAA